MSEGLLETALRLHQAGNLAEAGRLYSDILRADPRHLEALYRLALLHLQSGRFSDSEHLFAAAIRLNPQIPELFYGRGSALQGLGRYEESLASFARALALRPNYIEARNNRGVTLLKMKRYQDALATFETLNADDAYGRALIFNNRAAALLGLKRYREALENSGKSLALNPDQAGSLNTHASSLMALGRHEEALAFYDRALQLKPDFAEALNNRGSALRELKRLDEALASYDRAVELVPDFADALNHRGMVRLLVGCYREGWADHEWRWGTESIRTSRPEINARVWQGEDLRGRRIAVYSEQGYGDIIQFARYLPLLVRRGAAVTFSVPENLVRLLEPLRSQIDIVASIDAQEPFDYQCALMSLPLRFGTELPSIPNEVPYLAAETDRAARWKKEIAGHGFKVGIAWQGAPGGTIDQGRSIPLAEFVPLSKRPGVRLISLQKAHGLDQLAELPADAAVETLGDEFDGGPDAFVDTAAVMSHLDLIITSDTSIAHLAGALGRPTWVALKYVPDWRWLVDRDDSPWYPTMRLFRQETAGDWNLVFAKIEHALRSVASQGGMSPS
jgi:tetratricopeptide (TPR) repeat protein